MFQKTSQESIENLKIKDWSHISEEGLKMLLVPISDTPNSYIGFHDLHVNSGNQSSKGPQGYYVLISNKARVSADLSMCWKLKVSSGACT